MAENEALRNALEDLTEVLHLQAKAIERVVTHVEQNTGSLDPPSQLPLVVSELSELHNRLQARSTLPRT